jgi:hypothetical protein
MKILIRQGTIRPVDNIHSILRADQSLYSFLLEIWQPFICSSPAEVEWAFFRTHATQNKSFTYISSWIGGFEATQNWYRGRQPALLKPQDSLPPSISMRPAPGVYCAHLLNSFWHHIFSYLVAKALRELWDQPEACGNTKISSASRQ